MPSREWRFRVEDIVEAIDDISRLIAGLTPEDFYANATTVKAVLYNMAVIGEAARRIPFQYKDVLLAHVEQFGDNLLTKDMTLTESKPSALSGGDLGHIVA